MVNGPRRPRGQYPLNSRHFGYAVKHWRESIIYRRKSQRSFLYLVLLEEEQEELEDDMNDEVDDRLEEIEEEMEIFRYHALRNLRMYNIIRGAIITRNPDFRMFRPPAVVLRGQGRWGHWTLDDFTDEEIYHSLRLIARPNFIELHTSLALPPIVRLDNGSKFTSEELLLFYLYHRSFPTRLYDLQKRFGLEYSQISRALTTIKALLHHLWGHKVTNNLDSFAPSFARYNAAIQKKIRDLNNGLIIPRWEDVCCFLDGTLRQHNRYLCF